MPENWLRGQFNLSCERGTVGVFFTFPNPAAAIQHVAFRKLRRAALGWFAPTGPRRRQLFRLAAARGIT